MFLRELSAPLNSLKGVGPGTIRTLNRVGIQDLGSLLGYYPRDYEDRSLQIPLKNCTLTHPEVCTTIEVRGHEWFGFGRKKTLKIHIADESAAGVLLCFNRPFMEKLLQFGKTYRLWGRFAYSLKYRELQSSAFETEELTQSGFTWFGRILPVYPLTEGLTQVALRKLVETALNRYAPDLADELPEHIILRDGLLTKSQALRSIHFPASMDELERAKRSLRYEELFYLEILVGKRALERRTQERRATPPGSAQTKPESSPGNRASQSDTLASGETLSPCGTLSHHDSFSPLQKRLLERLPFELTLGQKEALTEINRDMAGPYPMARLLQGDVGSGKTLVSFLAALRGVEAGGQAALLAPTELLARQHAENAATLLEPLGIRPAFLTGNIKAPGRRALLENLAAGLIDFVVGTHALFSQDVIYSNLRLVVVDEQHRFGVTQRQAIMDKGDKPDLLMMSATPIPRTLALTVFGDLDVSIIRDMPPGRKPVKTHLTRMGNVGNVYQRVREELAAGRQAYFVYPLIGDSKTSPISAVYAMETTQPATRSTRKTADRVLFEEEERALKDAETMAARLRDEIFPGYAVALVHSRLDEKAKQDAMDAFRRGEVQILAATSVVEVGVDVPNATCMVIEHAERFGLSALHQLRGRVGRGSAQAYCYLIYSDGEGEDSLTEDGKTRLKVMLNHSDGFVIAEEDLKLRGPGLLAGIEQSGYFTLGMADPVRDAEELANARIDAFGVLEQDPALQTDAYQRIAQVLERAPPFSNIAF